LDWKDAPANIKNFMAQLGTLKTVLSETNTNICLNPDFAEAFHNRPSLLLSRLGSVAPSPTDTKLMLATCQRELECLLSELKKRAQGHRLGWERFKGAFLAKNIREAVDNLHRQCQMLNSMVSIDGINLGVNIYKEVKEAREEQQEWRQAETKVSSALKDGVDRLHQHQEHQEILDWLTSTDFVTQQADFIRRRQQGTGEWLLNSIEFLDWVKQSNQTLFCPGIPGAGKTIITAIVIDDLCMRYRNDANIGIAYLYFNFRRQHEQKLEDLLASLLKQLAQPQPSIPNSVKVLYDRHKDKRTRLSLDEILQALRVVISEFSKVFIVIDALDECQVSDGCRMRFLSEIFNLQSKCGASLFATSRFIPEITEKFKGSVSLEIHASSEDVRRYLDGHMSQLPAFVGRSLDLQEEIKTQIVKGVDGM
jgi:hypothetical protein